MDSITESYAARIVELEEELRSKKCEPHCGIVTLCEKLEAELDEVKAGFRLAAKHNGADASWDGDYEDPETAWMMRYIKHANQAICPDCGEGMGESLCGGSVCYSCAHVIPREPAADKNAVYTARIVELEAELALFKKICAVNRIDKMEDDNKRLLVLLKKYSWHRTGGVEYCNACNCRMDDHAANCELEPALK